MKSLYIHIPFCKQKCYYCDFLSFADKNQGLIGRYLEYLLKELSLHKNQTFKTIYIGGGTPSILSEAQIEMLLKGVEGYISDFMQEYTIEINPESFDEEKYQLMIKHGINRISIGVQSFSDKVLKALNRPTRSRDIYDSISIIQKNRFKNFNIDLIIGIQNDEEYIQDIKNAVSLMPTHISVYMLHLSKETKLYEMKFNNQFDLLDDDTLVQLYNYSCGYLRKRGYNHYEISNFGLHGFESKHNINYWGYGDYIGIGLGAVSKIKNKRFSNVSFLNDYFLKLDSNELPIENIEYLDKKKQEKERLMLGLRTNLGVDLPRILKTIGKGKKLKLADFEEFLKVLLINRYAKINSGKITLTEKGYLSSNYIISEFFEYLG